MRQRASFRFGKTSGQWRPGARKGIQTLPPGGKSSAMMRKSPRPAVGSSGSGRSYGPCGFLRMPGLPPTSSHPGSLKRPSADRRRYRRMTMHASPATLNRDGAAPAIPDCSWQMKIRQDPGVSPFRVSASILGLDAAEMEPWGELSRGLILVPPERLEPGRVRRGRRRPGRGRRSRPRRSPGKGGRPVHRGSGESGRARGDLRSRRRPPRG